MSIIIRSEKPTDYRQIAELHNLAFTCGFAAQETVLVDLHRHGGNFDPDLSLVAEQEGRIIGHALFYPHQMRIRGEAIQAVALAPIGILPEFQKQGIGGMLMEEGHCRAREKGHAFAFLLGHRTYYPRFGYRTGMFGTCNLKIATEDLPVSGLTLEEVKPNHTHLSILIAMWEEWYGHDDLALFPGYSILDWTSHAGNKRGVVLQVDGQIMGYLRYDTEKPEHPGLFLAVNQEANCLVLAHLREKAVKQNKETISLPLHAESSTVKKMLSVPFQPDICGWDAGMIKILDPSNQLIEDYCNDVAAGTRKPGNLIWPVLFDLV